VGVQAGHAALQSKVRSGSGSQIPSELSNILFFVRHVAIVGATVAYDFIGRYLTDVECTNVVA
jgi:hypothetical protein